MLQPVSDPKIDALSKVPLFASLSKPELEFVATRTDEVDAPAGRKLTTQGVPGDTFYALLDGEAKVEIDGNLRRTLKTGDFFGEISMLDRGLATATITTTKAPPLPVVTHAQFRVTIKANDALLLKTPAAIVHRLRPDLT